MITNNMKKTLGITMSVMLIAIMGMFLNSCSSGTTDDTTASQGRLISGELNSSASGSVSKATVSKDVAVDCIDNICGIIATKSTGETVEGTIYQDGALWKWEIRLIAGSWRIGFYDANGELLGNLEVNGISEFTLDEGEGIELGMVRIENGVAYLENDVAGLGELGFRSSDDFDETFDPNIFSIVKFKPQDGRVNIAPCRPIKIELSQAIDQTTLNENTILVTDQNLSVVAGTFEYEEEIETEDDGEIESEIEIKFEPAGGFALGSVITVSVLSKADGLLNTKAEPLDKDYVWSFTVRDFGGTSEVCHDPDEEYKQYREREREREGQDEIEDEGENEHHNGEENGNREQDEED